MGLLYKQCHAYGYPSGTDLYVEGESDVRVVTARHTHLRASESIEMRGKIGVKYDVVYTSAKERGAVCTYPTQLYCKKVSESQYTLYVGMVWTCLGPHTIKGKLGTT